MGTERAGPPGGASEGTGPFKEAGASEGTGPLAAIRASIHSCGDAVRWACVLEATAPKAGNVHPGQSFADLRYVQFVQAAEIAASVLEQHPRRIGEQVLTATRQTREQTGTNVNLGILLLLGPLVHTDRFSGGCALPPWPVRLQQWLRSGLSPEDAREVYQAIRIADPGGLGESESMDVRQQHEAPDDLLQAMRHAAPRDRVARQYATGFRDLWDRVVPVVRRAIEHRGDLLGGIAEAHVRLLAAEPDTLIVRKCGAEVAERVRQRAARVDPEDETSRRAFDAYLRSDGHRLNPGTTADLIAAALYVLLRSGP